MLKAAASPGDNRGLSLPCATMTPAATRAPFFYPLVAVALAASPLVFFPLVAGASRYDNQRLLELLCAVVAGLVVVGRAVTGRLPLVVLHRHTAVLLGSFSLLGLLSSAYAYSLRHALLEWANLLLLLGVAWLIAGEIQRGGDAALDRLLRFCGLGCAVYLLVEIGVYAAVMRAGGQPATESFIFGFDNYRFFNHIQTVSLPLLGLLATRTLDGAHRRFWWAVTALWWTLLFLSAGRGTALGLAAGLTGAAFFSSSAGRRWCLSMALAAVYGLVVYLVFFAAIPVWGGLQPIGLFFAVVERSFESPASGRLLLWSRALDMVATHPWLGSGPLHFAHAARDLRAGADPHNWLLQVASEWGVPALVLLVAVLFRAIRTLAKALRPLLGDTIPAQPTATALLVAGIAVVVDGSVSSLIAVAASQLWTAVYLGMAWGWVASRRNAPHAASKQVALGTRLAVMACAMGLLVALVWGVWPELQNLSGLRAEALRLSPDAGASPVFWPRIWLHGYF